MNTKFEYKEGEGERGREKEEIVRREEERNWRGGKRGLPLCRVKFRPWTHVRRIQRITKYAERSRFSDWNQQIVLRPLYMNELHRHGLRSTALTLFLQPLPMQKFRMLQL